MKSSVFLKKMRLQYFVILSFNGIENKSADGEMRTDWTWGRPICFNQGEIFKNNSIFLQQ